MPFFTNLFQLFMEVPIILRLHHQTLTLTFGISLRASSCSNQINISFYERQPYVFCFSCLVKILAEYLKYLDGNDSAYMRYFDWRKSSSVLSSLPHKLSSWCILCNMLNNSTLPKHSYANIHAWWFDQGQCEKDGTTIQHIIV